MIYQTPRIEQQQLHGKTALITGGESGIGLAIARLFVAEGSKVHLVGLVESKLQSAVSELGPSQASFTTADVSDEDAVREAIATAMARHGRIDIIVSNAGVSGVVADIVEYPTADLYRTFAVHVGGAFNCLKHGLPVMTDGGSVIIMSSVAGLTGFSKAVAYCTAKHAQVGLMRTAAGEVAGRRIRVNSIHPGPTSTAFQDDFEMRLTGMSREDAARNTNGLVPLGRHAQPEEVARVALYFASDASAMVTSTTFVIDGGLLG